MKELWRYLSQKDWTRVSLKCLRAVFTLLFLLGLTAQAAPLCSHLVLDSYGRARLSVDTLMKSLMLGNPHLNENELFVRWLSSFPYNLKKVEEDVWQVTHSGKSLRVHSNHPDLESSNPLLALNKFAGNGGSERAEMLQAVLKFYKARMSDVHIRAIEEVEAIIEDQSDTRQNFGYVATGPLSSGGVVLGTFRIQNGSPNHSATNPLTTMEQSLIRDKVPAQVLEKLRRIRAENPDALIFDIGKFTLDPKLDPATRDRARGLMELYLLRYYINALPDNTLYYVHTGSEAHTRMYTRRYGFRILEKIEIPGGVPEYILEATGAELRAGFALIYPTAPMESKILYP